ncbi:unnamed protein product [Caenorhabditis angaria]|uniref:Dihydropteridine reductase n=1 Tax=Caenorhabditis angaria TaxID=860376 RepID=A0A9P1ICN2_9PELO|nr:unnamed protein product [Caenorhabditis angaria]
MSSGKVIIYGGKGALGSAVLDYFKARNFSVLNIDLSSNEHADTNIVVNPSVSWVEQEELILKQTSDALSGSQVDGIFCVAGGWAGGSAASKDFIKNCDLMWKQSVWSSTIAARLAHSYLKPGGVLQLTGAAAANDATPGMIGYGLAKAAVHHLTKSLAEKDGGLPENSAVLTIQPITLDTPMNRKWMPKADHSSWTPLDYISENLHKWTTDLGSRPKSGSLLKITTTNGTSKIE